MKSSAGHMVDNDSLFNSTHYTNTCYIYVDGAVGLLTLVNSDFCPKGPEEKYLRNLSYGFPVNDTSVLDREAVQWAGLCLSQSIACCIKQITIEEKKSFNI